MIKKDTSIILALLVALAAAPKSLATVSHPILTTAATPAFPLPSAVPNGTAVRIDGSDSMTVPNRALKQGFEQQFPGTQVGVEAKGTNAALKALTAGQLDVAAIGRSLTSDEKAQGLTATPIAREKIAIVVGAGNSFNKSLTDEQFAKIFRGEITDWSQVGGTPGRIRLIDRPDDSDTRNALRNYPVFKAAPFGTGATATRLDEDITARMVQDLGKDGIGYATASQVMNQSDVRVLPMHQILPTDPRYPFSQPRAYVYKQSPSPAVAAFLGYVTSAAGGQAIGQAESGTGSIAPSLVNTAASPTVGGTAGSVVASSSPLATSSTTVSPATETPASATAPGNTALAPSPNNQVDVTDSGGGWWWLVPLALLGGVLFWWFSRRRAAPDQATVYRQPPADPSAIQEVPPPIDPDLPPVEASETGTVAAGSAAVLAVPTKLPNTDEGVTATGETVAEGLTLAARAESIIASDRAADDDRAPAAELGRSDAEIAASGSGLSAAAMAPAGGAVAESMLRPDRSAEADTTEETPTTLQESIDPAVQGSELTPFPVVEPTVSDRALPYDSDISAAQTPAAQTEDPTEAAAALDPLVDDDDLAGAMLLGDATAIDRVVVTEVTTETVWAGDEPIAEVTEVTEVTTETVWAGDEPIAEVVEVTTETWIDQVPLSAEELEEAATPEATPGEDQLEAEQNLFVEGAVAAGIGIGSMLIISAESDAASDVAPDASAVLEPDISRTQADVTATKFDVGRSIPTEELASVDEGLADLPDGYGDSRIVLMPRDPQWAYAYWDVSNEHKQALRQQGSVRLALRLCDVTDVDVNMQHPHSLQQYDCDEMARDWYLPIPVSDRDYIAEIGYVTGNGGWLMLARSAPVRIPPTYPADWFDEQFVAIDWDENLRGRTFLELVPPDQESPLVADNAIYDEIFETTQSVEAQRIAGSLFGSMQQAPEAGLSSAFPSGAGLWAADVPGIAGMSGIGISGMSGIGGASIPPIRSRKFWLVADAELIVYGATEPDATVTIGGRPIQLNPDGTFRFQISFQDGAIDYPIIAIAADGEQTRSIHMEFNRETPQRNTNSKDEAIDEWFS